jgi:N-acylneuraminate cytidylyltransferase
MTTRQPEHARLAVIPARGGSKRLPKKNLRELGGKPLLAHSIVAAQESGLFERIVVSTDSPEIAAAAARYGAEVPFLREAQLADDVTSVSEVTLDVLRRIDPAGGTYTHVCQLMANCPLRTGCDIRSSYEQFVRSGAGAQISVVRFGWQNPWWALRRAEHFVLEPLFEDALTQRSQDLPPLYCPTGAVWWAEAETLRRHRTYHIPGRTGWEMPWDHGVDIDTEEDWLVADVLFRLQQANRASVSDA